MATSDETTEPMSVSVVIPARNAADSIGEQLDALAAQVYEGSWEIVVADNGSSDATAAVVAGYVDRVPSLRIVDASARIGINAARNAGIRHAKSERILICDADDIVDPGWIDSLATALDDFDIVGGPLDESSLNETPAARARAAFRTDALTVAGNFLPYAFGCNIGFRRKVWESLSGFDEEWIRGSTEIEFCWRAQLSDFRIGFARDAVIRYRYRPDLPSILRQIRTSAESQPRLFAAFRDAGMPRSRTKTAAVDWAWLAYHVLDLRRNGAKRIKWLEVFTMRSGRLRGSIRHRVVYL